MARPKSLGAYAPLSATYYLDDAILEAGEAAELLFVRSLSFLATSSSDGFITERQMHAVVGMGMRNVSHRVADLLRVGLLSQVEGGFVVRSWLKWNKSTEEIGKHLRRDRERKANAKPGNMGESTRIPDGIRVDSAGTDESFPADSSDQYTSHHYTAPHDTTQHTSQATESITDLFDDAYASWPKKVKRGEALTRFRKACNRIQPTELVAHIKRFGSAYETTTEHQYIPALGPWLNQERWTDELPQASHGRGAVTNAQRNLSVVQQFKELESA